MPKTLDIEREPVGAVVAVSPDSGEEIIKKGNMVLCELRVKRSMGLPEKVKDAERKTAYLEIWIKSQIIEDFFKSLHGGKRKGYLESELWGNGYPNDGVNMVYLEHVELDRWGENRLSIDGKLQMSFLRAVGLSEGVVFKVPGMFSKEIIDYYTKNFPEAVRALYINFIKPVNIFVEITTREVTRE
jgi:hypothetical protein